MGQKISASHGAGLKNEWKMRGSCRIQDAGTSKQRVVYLVAERWWVRDSYVKRRATQITSSLYFKTKLEKRYKFDAFYRGLYTE